MADVLDKLEGISSNNKMQEVIADFLRKVSIKEIGMITHFMLGEIAPAYADINIGMAEKMVLKAIAKANNKSEWAAKRAFKERGDVGLVAEGFAKKHRQLTVREVFEKLHQIAKAAGSGSQEEKTSMLAGLLKKAGKKEARFLARIVVGNLRLGASVMTVITALAMAFTGSKKNKGIVEAMYNTNPDIGEIAEQIAKKGVKEISGVSIGRPIKMMLCQRIKNLEKIGEKMRVVSVEDKLDGERIQAHRKQGRITLFSRRMENITNQFPDVAEACRKNVKATNYIIEGEAIPVDKWGAILPFQLLMKRRRKHDIKKYVKQVPVCYFVFDILYLQNKSCMQKPYPARRNALEKLIKNSKQIQTIRNKITERIEEIKKFFKEAVARGAEGIVIKSCAKDSVYKSGTRAWLWVKWKKEYAKGMGDTFDLAVVGAFSGRGKRKGGYGSLLCAAYNNKADRFETFCKLGSGFTDRQLAELPGRLRRYTTAEKPANVDAVKEMRPDVWFKPDIVVEVLGTEITKSPIHSCARKQGKGLALRFPRFVRYREDKNATQATTTKEIVQMYGKK